MSRFTPQFNWLPVVLFLLTTDFLGPDFLFYESYSIKAWVL